MKPHTQQRVHNATLRATVLTRGQGRSLFCPCEKNQRDKFSIFCVVNTELRVALDIRSKSHKRICSGSAHAGGDRACSRSLAQIL